MNEGARKGKSEPAGPMDAAVENLQISRRFEVTVSADGGTVWVNGGDGASIGRFSKRFGVDVHRTSTEQMEGLGQCLACTHERAGPKEWEEFRSRMLEHHGVRLKRSLVRF